MVRAGYRARQGGAQRGSREPGDRRPCRMLWRLTPGSSTSDGAERRKGLLCGLGAYGIWGLLPVYLKALAAATPVEILCHRVLWAQLFLVAVVWWSGRLPEVRAAFRPSRALATLGLT